MALVSEHVENGLASSDPRTRLASEVLSETLEECERLLEDAERAADALRRAGEDDAARIRRDAVRANAALGDEIVSDAEHRANSILAVAEERIRQMTAAAQERLAEAEALAASWRSQQAATEARVVELDARRAAVHEAARIAGGLAAGTLRDAERWAERRQTAAEDAAVELLDRAWRAASELQEELLREAEDEAEAILDVAVRDADRARAEAAEAAERLRRSAAAHAEMVLLGALQAEPTSPPAAPPVAAPPVAAPPVAAPPVAAPPVAGAPAGDRRWRRARAASRRLLRGAGVVALVLVIAMALRTVVGEPYTVSAMSMSPTLEDGERIFVNKASYRFGEPGRGDIVVLDGPRRAAATGWAWSTREELLVKRVVGLPGETVEGLKGWVLVDGRLLPEPYLPAGSETPPFPASVVPDGSVFVLGDNRRESIDSRSFGAVPVEVLVGRADAVIWPPGSIGRL